MNTPQMLVAKMIKTNIDPLQYVYHNKNTRNIPEINFHEINSVISSLQVQRRDMIKYQPQS